MKITFKSVNANIKSTLNADTSVWSCRCFKQVGESYIKVPFFGAVSYLTVAVSPFCIAFAVVWAVYRNVSFAWIGQDVLVRKWCQPESIFNYMKILKFRMLLPNNVRS